MADNEQKYEHHDANTSLNEYVAAQMAVTSGGDKQMMNIKMEGRKSKTRSETQNSEGLYRKMHSVSSVATVDGDLTTSGLPLTESVDMKSPHLEKHPTPFEYKLNALEDAIEEGSQFGSDSALSFIISPK